VCVFVCVFKWGKPSGERVERKDERLSVD